SRRGGSSSTNSPFAMCPSITSTRYCPPGRGSSHARLPNQRAIFSGSTRNSQTVSGLAAISTSRSTVVSVVVSMLPLLPFCLALQCVEALLPELLEEVLELCEPLGPWPEKPPCSFPTLVHESRLLQHREKMRAC